MTDDVASRVEERIVDRLRMYQGKGGYLSDVAEIKALPIFDRAPPGFLYKPVSLCVAAFDVEWPSKMLTTRTTLTEVHIAVVGQKYGPAADGKRTLCKVVGQLASIIQMEEKKTLWGNRDPKVAYAGDKAIALSTHDRPVATYGGLGLSEENDNVFALFARIRWTMVIDDPWPGTWTV